MAKATTVLAKATTLLAEIEDKRDRETARLRRRERLRMKLELTDKVNRMTPEKLFRRVESGVVLEGDVAVFRKLHYYVEFGVDKVMEKDVNRLLLRFDNSIRGSISPDAVEVLGPVLERIQDRLSMDQFGWREELVELS